MVTPIESAVEGSLEGSRGGRVLVPTTCRATITLTALHHYQGRNYYVPERLASDLTTLELSKLLRKRLQQAEVYGRRRRSQWRLLASLTKLGALGLSAAATIMLGFADLNGLAAAGFVCSALVTTIGAIEPYFNLDLS